MFKVTEGVYRAASDSANHSTTQGVYHQKNLDDSYGETPRVLVDPNVTEKDKVTILHWAAEETLMQYKPIEFVIRKNGARGNVNVKLVNVKNQSKDLPLDILDPDRYSCKFIPVDIGIQKIRIYLNTVEISQSPISFYVRESDQPVGCGCCPQQTLNNDITGATPATE